MRLEIMQKGAHGPDGPLAVGDVLGLPGDQVPGWLAGKVRLLDDAPRVAVTNPAEDPVVDPQLSAQERQAILGEVAARLNADDFGTNGVPDVRAINRALSDGVEKFSAGERDQLWPGIADAVMARRG